MLPKLRLVTEIACPEGLGAVKGCCVKTLVTTETELRGLGRPTGRTLRRRAQ